MGTCTTVAIAVYVLVLHRAVCNSIAVAVHQELRMGEKPGTCQNEALGKKLCLRKQNSHVPALDPRRKRNEAIPAENLREQGPAEAALRESAKQGEKKKPVQSHHQATE